MNTLLLAASPSATLPSAWMVLPFVLLLGSIALLPLLAENFWHHHYPKVAVGLGAITACYYIFVQKDTASLAHVTQEYVSFMALVGSLFVISGGINVRVKGEATPAINTLFLAIGAILANIIGTTGASMLLIRPWIRMNKYRITGLHIVFFIFVVSNCGGCLTPIGDPPLFLGFLRGVPFWWTLVHCWPAWAACVGLLLVVFYVLDQINFHRAPKEVRELETAHEEWTFRGLGNFLLLAIVLASVFIDPHHAWGPFTLTSVIMMAAALVSYFGTRAEIHEANDFNLGPVKEVGWLFIGIFLTMLPALAHLQSGDAISLTTPLQYYFATGSLSAFLDNAPTYLAFLASEMGMHHLDVNKAADVAAFAAQHEHALIAVSLGAVFFGAGSYIGNGPNFMVKAIAEKAKVNTPGFLGYILCYSLPILVPILILIGWIFV
jgi:Na+/H+ antiporter NhaD/arsenite permease-like protein